MSGKSIYIEENGLSIVVGQVPRQAHLLVPKASFWPLVVSLGPMMALCFLLASQERDKEDRENSETKLAALSFCKWFVSSLPKNKFIHI